MAKKRREIQTEKKSINRRSGRRKKAAGVSTTLIVIVLIIIGLLAYLYYSKIVVPTRESKEPLSILLIGSDLSSFREDYFMGTKPEKTDSLILVTFNPDTYTVDMTSIPRDTSVDYICDSIQDPDGVAYTGEAYQDQINELYQVSGHEMSCLTDTVSNFLNVPIDYYVKVNMDQLAEIIDAVGGVEIEVYAPDYYLSQENASLTETYSWTSGEVVTMDGDEALTYARARHDSEKDYGRGIRQQQVIGAIASNILSSGINIDLINNLFSLVETDMPIKLIYEYYKYMMDITTIMGLIEGTGTAELDDLPDSVWLNLYDLTGFDGDLTGTNSQREKEIAEFTEYLTTSNVDQEAVKSEVMKNHQLYNSAYSAHYNVEYDQLYEVSNELRSNLGLEEEDVEVPSYPYGNNSAYGLLPSETTKAKEGIE